MKKRKKNNSIFNIPFLVKSILLLGLGVLVMSALSSRKAARVMGLDIEVVPLENNALLIQEDEVKHIIYEGYRRDVEEMTIQDVDILELEKLLESEPFIGDADVYVNAADVLEINVLQEQPVARVMDVKGVSYYLSKDFKAFPISKHASARVVVFSGTIDDFNHKADSLTIIQEGVIEVIKTLSQDQFLRKMTEQIHVNSLGQFLVIPKMGKFKFDLGEPMDLKQKMSKIELAYKEVIPKKGWNTYKTIDLSIDDQIICRK